MASRHLSLRLETEVFERLEAASRRSRLTRSELARTLLEEGLRMAEHPGIVFRPGPAGRRPGVSGGPDVWEIIRVLKDVEARNEDAISRTARSLGITSEQVRAALRYYAEFSAEIDDWIERVDQEAARAEAFRRREQALLSTP